MTTQVLTPPHSASAAALPLRVAFVLPGLHRVVRGAEVAFESIAAELARLPGFDVTLIGSGQPRDGHQYRFIHAGCILRERFRRWPRVPLLRTDCVYEELTFASHLLGVYRPGDFDVTVGCSYPYVNWVLRARRRHGRRPAHVYVTQNGDWPLAAGNREYSYFGCDGLVCTNPTYLNRYTSRFPTALIPNGVDLSRFVSLARTPRPAGAPIHVAIVSALIPSKRVIEGIRSVSLLPNASLAIAGDGPQAPDVDRLGRELLGHRYRRVTLKREQMPSFYAAADVLLHMSMDEPFGNIYVEASACGIPVVAHGSDSTRWILEDNGHLIDTMDLQAIARVIKLAATANTPSDAARRRDLVVRRFSWAAIAQAYGEFLHKVSLRTAPVCRR